MFCGESESMRAHRLTGLLDNHIIASKGVWNDKFRYVEICKSDLGQTAYYRWDNPSYVYQIFSKEDFLARKEILISSGRLKEKGDE